MKNKNNLQLKKTVIALRKKGKTYGEIRKSLGIEISKSTLSSWCAVVSLTFQQKLRIEKEIKNNLKNGRLIAVAVNRAKRKQKIENIRKRVSYLAKLLNNKDIAKISLAMLYLGEGSKRIRGSLMFGNSDPRIITLFLHLLRYCYSIDEEKFRCTLQCRADQDIEKLENFWSEKTRIPRSKFYKARIDPRTIGKKSKKSDYKGVCRIDYFSANLFIEIKEIIEVLEMGI